MEKKRILIIDDDQTTLKILGEHLIANYDVSVSSSYKSSLKILEKKEFDVFLVDISLEDGNGIDLCKIIKKEEKYQFTPVIFITHHEEIAYIKKVFDVGGDDYILKPINLTELDIRIQRRLEVSAKQEELLKEYEDISKQLIDLSTRMYEESSYLVSEDSLHENSKKFKANSEKINLNIQNSIYFEKRIEEMKEKINKQRELIQKAKSFLE